MHACVRPPSAAFSIEAVFFSYQRAFLDVRALWRLRKQGRACRANAVACMAVHCTARPRAWWLWCCASAARTIFVDPLLLLLLLLNAFLLVLSAGAQEKYQATRREEKARKEKKDKKEQYVVNGLRHGF